MTVSGGAQFLGDATCTLNFLYPVLHESGGRLLYLWLNMTILAKCSQADWSRGGKKTSSSELIIEGDADVAAQEQRTLMCAQCALVNTKRQ